MLDFRKRCRSCLNNSSFAHAFFLTCLCAYTTLPNSFQVPPRRSIRTIRKIWKKRRPRSALVANTWPLEPIPITTNDAAMVITSWTRKLCVFTPKWKTTLIVGAQGLRNNNLNVNTLNKFTLTYYTKRPFQEFQSAHSTLVPRPTSRRPKSVKI